MEKTLPDLIAECGDCGARFMTIGLYIQQMPLSFHVSDSVLFVWKTGSPEYKAEIITLEQWLKSSGVKVKKAKKAGDYEAIEEVARLSMVERMQNRGFIYEPEDEAPIENATKH